MKYMTGRNTWRVDIGLNTVTLARHKASDLSHEGHGFY